MLDIESTHLIHYGWIATLCLVSEPLNFIGRDLAGRPGRDGLLTTGTPHQLFQGRNAGEDGRSDGSDKLVQ